MTKNDAKECDKSYSKAGDEESNKTIQSLVEDRSVVTDSIKLLQMMLLPRRQLGKMLFLHLHRQ